MRLCKVCGSEIVWREGMTKKQYNRRQTCGSKECFSKMTQAANHSTVDHGRWTRMKQQWPEDMRFEDAF
jgi:hypothetical protein